MNEWRFCLPFRCPSPPALHSSGTNSLSSSAHTASPRSAGPGFRPSRPPPIAHGSAASTRHQRALVTEMRILTAGGPLPVTRALFDPSELLAKARIEGVALESDE